MRRHSIWVWLFCSWTAAAALGADPPPGVPPLSSDSSDLLPPPLDLDHLTPVSLPNSLPATPTAQAQAVLNALDKGLATPLPTAPPLSTPLPAQSATPLPAVPGTPTPSATPIPPALPTPSPTEAPSQDLSGAGAYFPAVPGSRWSYEYLKAPAGAQDRTARKLECKSRVAQADGSVKALFLVTEDGKSLEQDLSITAAAVTKASGEFLLQLPAKGTVPRWASGGNYYKAVLGKGLVYRTTYPDCVIVTEKTRTEVRLSYYAKGIGLVAVEVYGPGMKLDQERSIALVQGPAGP